MSIPKIKENIYNDSNDDWTETVWQPTLERSEPNEIETKKYVGGMVLQVGGD